MLNIVDTKHLIVGRANDICIEEFNYYLNLLNINTYLGIPEVFNDYNTDKISVTFYYASLAISRTGYYDNTIWITYTDIIRKSPDRERFKKYILMRVKYGSTYCKKY